MQSLSGLDLQIFSMMFYWIEVGRQDRPLENSDFVPVEPLGRLQWCVSRVGSCWNTQRHPMLSILAMLYRWFSKISRYFWEFIAPYMMLISPASADEGQPSWCCLHHAPPLVWWSPACMRSLILAKQYDCNCYQIINFLVSSDLGIVSK